MTVMMTVKNSSLVQKIAEASSPRLAGRPRKDAEEENFIRFCKWLEGEGDSFFVVTLHGKMKELAKFN